MRNFKLYICKYYLKKEDSNGEIFKKSTKDRKQIAKMENINLT